MEKSFTHIFFSATIFLCCWNAAIAASSFGDSNGMRRTPSDRKNFINFAAPVCSPDNASTPSNKPVEIFPLANDSDPDGDSIFLTNVYFTNAGDAAKGSFVYDAPSGKLTFTPNGASFGCTGTGTISLSYTISDDGTPASTCNTGQISIIVTASTTAALTTPSNIALCAGSSSGGVAFTGTDVAYVRWVNNNTNIGLAASGTGNIAAFNLVNNTAADIVATITATPYNASDCVGNPVNFTITARALPQLTGALLQPAICSGLSFNYTPATSPAGASYTWSRNAVTGISNQAASGTGAISEQLLNTTGASTVNVEYRFSLVSPTGNCLNTQDVTVPVKPSGTAAAITAANVSVCSNVAATLTASSTLPGSTYKWYDNPQLTGVPVATSASFTTPKISANKSYYVTVQNANVCENLPGTAKQVDVTVSAVCGALTPSGCSATGSLLMLDDFGGNKAADPNYSSTPLPPGTTTYGFAAGASRFPPQNNQYSITKNPNGNGFAQWYTSLTDHTGSGYMAIFNADLAPGTFYADTLKNLCSGTKLFFSAWAISMFRNTTGGINPNLTFILSNPVTGEVLSKLFTGDIPNADKNWRQYGLNFTVPSGLSAVALNIVNNAPGGTGNDVALDDIAVYACLPPVTVTGLKTGGIYCPGETLSLTANYTDDGSLGTGFVYQWYYSETGDLHSWESWSQVPGGNTSVLNRPAATGYYRAVVGNPVNVTTGNFNCCAISNAAQVTVNPGPAVDSIKGSKDLCAGSSTTLTNTTAGGSWISSNPAVASVNNSGVVTGVAAGSATINYSVAGAAGGCSTIVSATVTVHPAPDVASVASQESCADNAGSTSSIPVQFSGTIPGTVFNWTMDRQIGYNPSGAGNIPGFPFKLPAGEGAVAAVVTVTPEANGCKGQPVTFTYKLNPYPDILVDVNNASQCLEGNQFVFTNNTKIPPGETVDYTWTFDDGTVLTTANASHSFQSAGLHYYSLRARTLSGCERIFDGSVNVLPMPAATFTYEVISPNSNDNYSFSVGDKTPEPAIVAYYWDFGDGGTSTLPNPAHAYTANGTYEVTLTVTTSDGCTAEAKETIVVNKEPNVTAGFTINNGNQCLTGNNFVFTNTTATANGITVTGYAWNFGDGGSSSAESPSHTYTSPGVYTVMLTVTTSTGFQDVVTQSVNVYPVPSMEALGNQALCNNMQTRPVSFGSTSGQPVYNWVNSNPAIGLPAAGTGAIAPFTAINTGSIPVTATITVTPVQNGCAGAPVSFTITVNPTPAISTIADITICNGETVPAVNITSSVATASFQWSNSNTAIGLAANGIGNIPPFTAINNTSLPVTATITVRANAGNCAGSDETFTITVNPAAALTSALNATGICSGTSFAYLPTSSVAGATFTWRRLAASGIAEPVTSGTGNINEVLTNTTTTIVEVQYVYTSAAPGGCQHMDTVRVKVNPVPAVAPPPLSLSACNNALLAVQPFSSNIPGATFIWTNDNPAIGLASSGTGNIASFVTANNTGVPLTANISVVAVGNYVAIRGVKDGPPISGCVSTPQRFTITVQPTPEVTRIGETNVCPNAMISLPAFSSPIAATVYNWTVDQNIGLPLSGTGNLPSFVAVNPTLSPVTANITVTPAVNGCEGLAMATKVTVSPTPAPALSINNAAQCLDGNSFIFTDKSVAGSNLTYTWDFGDGTTSSEQHPAHSYASPGVYTVTLTTGTVDPVCQPVTASNTVEVYEKPDAAFNYQTISSNSNDSYQFTSKSTIAAGSITGYFWEFGDGATSALAQPQHTYAASGAYTVKLTVTSGNGCIDTTSSNIQVTTTPNLTAGFTINSPAQCLSGNSFLFTNTTIASPGTVISGYSWDLGDGSPVATSQNATHTYAAAGTYIVTLTATAANGYSDIVTQSITVYPTPSMNDPADQSVCAGTPTQPVRFLPSVPGLTFTWTNNHPEIGLAANGAGGTIPAFTAVNAGSTPIVATIVVTPAANSCSGTAQTFTITVKPQATVSGYSAQAVCAGSPTTAVNFTSNIPEATFAWVNDNSATGIAASGTGAIPSITALNAGTTPEVSNITVRPAFDGCIGSLQNFIITVNPVPVLTSGTDGGDVCSGTLFNYTPTGNIAGTTFSWSRAAVTGISNAAATGTGNPAEMLINTTGQAVVVTYIYTLAASGCTSTAYNVQVTVNPAATLSSTTTPPAICHNSLFSYNPESVTPGTVFNWTRAADAYNPAASGTGNPLEALQNTGTLPITVTYDYTLTANGCTGAVQHVQVTVNPVPTDDFTSNGPQCLNGNNFLFTLDPDTGAATYAWNFGDGATGSGVDPSHSYTVDGAYPVTLTITSAAGCVKTITHPVLVTPSPVAQFIYNSIMPNSNDQYQFTDRSIISAGALAGYNWDFGDGAASTDQNPVHAYVADGTYTVTLTITSALGCSSSISQTVTVSKNPNVIAGFTIDNASKCITGNSFTFTNNSTVTGTTVLDGYVWDFGDGSPTNNDVNPVHVYSTPGTYVVRLTATGHDGATIFTDVATQSVIVFATPDMQQPADQTVCNQSSTRPVFFKPVQPGLSFSWTMNADIGGGTSGTGNIAAFTASNTGTAPTNATVTVTPVANGCTGTAKTFTITVNPTADITALSDQVICAEQTTTAVNFTDNVAGTVFTWVNNNTSTGIAASGTGGIPAITALNAGNTPSISTIRVTPVASGCAGAESTFNITVNPLPVLTSPADAGAVCSNNAFSYLPASNVAGTVFSWSRAAVTGISNFAANGTGDPAETLVNTTAAPVTVTYVYTLIANGCQNPVTFPVLITVNPVATLTSTTTPPAICSGAMFVYAPASATAGTRFAWSRAALAGISNPAASGNGNPVEILINTTDQPVTVTYEYVLTAAGCSSEAQQVQVVVNPAPGASFSINDTTQCLNGNSFVFTNTSGAGTYTWDLGDGTVANTTNVTHSYALEGSYTVRLLAATSAGCVDSAALDVIVHPSPTAGFIYNVVSSNTSDQYQFTSTSLTSAGPLAYNWNFGDGTTSNETAPLHTYTASGNYTVTLTVTGPGGCQSSATHQLTVSKDPDIVPGFTVDTTAQCVSGNSFAFTNTTTFTPGATVAYSWNFGDGAISTDQNPLHTYAAAGAYTVTLTVTGERGYSAVIAQSVLVFPQPVVNPVQAQSVCAGTPTANINFGGGITSTTYNWANDHPEIGLPATGSGNIRSFTAANNTGAPVTATIQVTPVSNGCTGTPQTFTITVRPVPATAGVNDQLLCEGSPTQAISFNSTVAGATFTWQNNNVSIGLAASGTGNIPSFNVQNGGTNVNNAAISVIATADGCAGAAATFTIGALPTPVLTSPLTGSVCDDAMFSYIPAGNVGNAVFNWSRAAVPGIANPAASGTGNPEEVLNNTTDQPVVATYIYTVNASGCSTSANVPVTVQPKPQLNNSDLSTAICNNTAFVFTPQSNTPGIQYFWSRNPAAGIDNAPASGTGAISETLINSTEAPVYVPYEYTLNAGGCLSNYSVGVTVNPSPVITSGTDTMSMCSGKAFSYTPGSNAQGVGFTWSRAEVPGISNPPASGTGAISEVLVNTGNIAVNVNYVLTADYEDCRETQTITVTVNPAPAISSVLQDLKICAGTSVSALTLNGPVPGTLYNWTNNNSSTGLPGSGTNVIPAFIARNQYPDSIISRITINAVTPAGCTLDDAGGYSIEVDPSPSAEILAPKGTRLCEGGVIMLVASGGDTYQWYKDGAAVGGASGSVLFVNSGGTYTISSATNKGCSITQAGSTAVQEIFKPVAAFTLSGYCLNIPVTFTDQSIITGSGDVAYEWMDNAGHTSTERSPVFAYAQTGAYTVQLKVTPVACPLSADSTTKTFTIEAPQPGLRLAAVNTVANSPAQLQARNIGATAYLWAPVNGLSNPTIANPIARIAATQDYRVAMTMASGCVTTDSVLVRVLGTDSIFIPNTITPNGDGKNEYFVITGLDKFPGSELFIYNRWQNEVYHHLNYQNNWDGQGLNPGTYYYLLKLKTSGGVKVYTGWVLLEKKFR